MMIKLKGDLSGTRNGQPWPARGEVMNLPDTEGAALCAVGMAVPLAEDAAETATPADDTEVRATGRGRRGSRKRAEDAPASSADGTGPDDADG